MIQGFAFSAPGREKARKLAIYLCKSDNPHGYWLVPVRFLSDMLNLSDFKPDKPGNCRRLRPGECRVAL